MSVLPRTGVAAALLLTSALALTGPVSPTYAAAAVCQGEPATIEGSTGTITGTEGNDVIVSTGAGTTVVALGGNDLICVVGGRVAAGPGDDSVLSAGTMNTSVSLSGGNDSYASDGPGPSVVVVDAITSFHVTFGGTGFASVQLDPTTIPGTGTIDYGTTLNNLDAFALEDAAVNLAEGTVNLDGLLSVTTTGLHGATATGCKVRMKGDGGSNVLRAYGHDVVMGGGGGRDWLTRVGNGFDLDLPKCGRYRSVLRGQGGIDRLYGRLGPDVLIGGPGGRDVANGAGGVDTCRVEVKRNCER